MHGELGDFVVEILQNAVESGGTSVNLDIIETDHTFTFTVQDNGRGMNLGEQTKALDPFYSDGRKHPGRRVGLGLPFLKQTLEAVGGRFDLKSHEGRGTMVQAEFLLTHIDTPPVGDVPMTLVTCLAFPGNHEMVITRKKYRGTALILEYQIDRNQLLEAAGELEEPGTLSLLREFIESQEDHNGET